MALFFYDYPLFSACQVEYYIHVENENRVYQLFGNDVIFRHRESQCPVIGRPSAGIDGLSAEHLLFCHPALSVVLAKLFQLMMICSYVPDGFRYSYIVPLPKPKECFSKSLQCDDFRGIAFDTVKSV